MGRLQSLGLAVAAAAVFIALPAAAGGAPASPARAAANTMTYQDSVGDSTGADITSTVVSNTDAGVVTFQINTPNRAQYSPDIVVLLYVDTDNNLATGSQLPDNPPGIDYVIEVALGEINLFRWDGTDFTRQFGDPPATTLVYSWEGGAKISIGAAELGNTKRFNFLVQVISGLVTDPTTGDLMRGPDTADDFSPQLGTGYFNFEVKIAPERLLVKSFSTTPANPLAGKPFTVRMSAIRSDTNAVLSGGQVLCTAVVGSKRLPARTHKFVGKQALCVFQIPANAQGKRIRGSITIVFEGKKATKGFVFTIR